MEKEKAPHSMGRSGEHHLHPAGTAPHAKCYANSWKLKKVKGRAEAMLLPTLCFTPAHLLDPNAEPLFHHIRSLGDCLFARHFIHLGFSDIIGG